MNDKSNGNPDYLVIGHITHDLHAGGYTIGGTAAYASLTAKSLGRIPAVLTAGGKKQPSNELNGIIQKWKYSPVFTAFENIETGKGRKQILRSIADDLMPEDVSSNWQDVSIVHLGPVANEVHPDIMDVFPNAVIGLTPQGWMRARDENNVVHFHPWKHADKLLQRANAVVLSIEDVLGDFNLISSFANKTDLLAVTEGNNGAFIYSEGKIHHFSAPKVQAVDPTGAGDIFAAVFFDQFERSRDPWASARTAVHIASYSTTRTGLGGIPTPDEIDSFRNAVAEGK